MACRHGDPSRIRGPHHPCREHAIGSAVVAPAAVDAEPAATGELAETHAVDVADDLGAVGQGQLGVSGSTMFAFAARVLTVVGSQPVLAMPTSMRHTPSPSAMADAREISMHGAASAWNTANSACARILFDK